MLSIISIMNSLPTIDLNVISSTNSTLQQYNIYYTKDSTSTQQYICATTRSNYKGLQSSLTKCDSNDIMIANITLSASAGAYMSDFTLSQAMYYDKNSDGLIYTSGASNHETQALIPLPTANKLNSTANASICALWFFYIMLILIVLNFAFLITILSDNCACCCIGCCDKFSFGRFQSTSPRQTQLKL